MKKLLSLILALVLALGLSTAALAEEEDAFDPQLTVTENDSAITIELNRTAANDRILAERKPTLTVPCRFTGATVTDPDGKAIACTIANGEICFTVDRAGVYTITNTGSVTTDPVVPVTPAQKPQEQRPDAEKNPFADVKEGQYYYEAVLWAAEKKITSGLTAESFGPEASCTRAQLITFLHRAMGSPAPKGDASAFADVEAGSYYEAAVRWAVENGITSGVTPESFGPDASCTRAQFVMFLYRAAGSPAPKSAAMPFEDVPSGSYYEAAVRWAVENGITTGVSGTRFAPDAPCARGQIVTFLYRYLGK